MSDQPKQENLDGQVEAEQTHEAILDALELAFKDGVQAELTVLEPSGELRTYAVFVEGLEGGVLYVSVDKDSPAMPIEINSVRKVKN